MSSILKVDSITDVNGNAIISSDGSGNISIPNLTTTGDINFGDNDKAIFGTGGDLEIYHDGSNSYVAEGGSGTGNLIIKGNSVLIRNNSDENYIHGISNGEVRLYYDNAQKLATTSSGIDVTGTVVSDGLTVDTDTLYVDSSNNRVGVGTNSPARRFHIHESSASTASHFMMTTANTGLTTGDGFNLSIDGTSSNVNFIQRENADMAFYTNGGANERMRIDSSGNVLVGTTLTAVHNQNSVGGVVIEPDTIGIARNGNAPLLVNRAGSDGNVINIYAQGNFEGDISVSGSLVTFNGFTGTHWSRLSDNSKPTILKGTILESLDEMMDWYQVQFDITDDEGNTTTHKESYALGDGENVGDVITYNYNTEKQDDDGNDIIEQVQATIIQEDDIKHVKSKISDTVDAKNVYGVFVAWDNDDDTVNDMYVAQTGSCVIRINVSETVSKGDLIQSNGDGTGKVQADDIIRASTVAKVLSTTKIETYDDGSYIVPCTLHC